MKRMNLRLQLITDWKRAYRIYSIWGVAILGASSDLWNLAIALGLIHSEFVPTKFSWMTRVLAAVVIGIRLVKQQKLEQLRHRKR